MGELARVSPEVARALRKILTKVRQPLPKPKGSLDVLQQESLFPYMQDDLAVFQLEYDAVAIEDLPWVNSVYITTEEDRMNDPRVSAGGIMVPDPYVQYLASITSDEFPKQVYVGEDSAALRCIFPTVNSLRLVESVIDSGSQIVSMALSEAEELMLTWDPDVQIYMQSANGQLKKSAGLARNVAFDFGGITVYLQVHIIDQPAYKILLGRPFDILTESRIRNRANGTQTVTLKDPNTKKRITLPTHTRGTFSSVTRPVATASAESEKKEELPKSKEPRQSEGDSKRATVEEVDDNDDESVSSDEEAEFDATNDIDMDFRRSSMK